MRKLMSCNLFLLVFCASCAQAQKQENFSPPTSKPTAQLNHGELFVGKGSKEPLSKGLLAEAQPALQCFGEGMMDAQGFIVQIQNGAVKLIEGDAGDVSSVVACFKEKNLFKLLNNHWLWTPNFDAPAEVRKNFASLKSNPLRIFKGPKGQ